MLDGEGALSLVRYSSLHLFLQHRENMVGRNGHDSPPLVHLSIRQERQVKRGNGKEDEGPADSPPPFQS